MLCTLVSLLDDLAYVDQVHLPPFTLVRRINYDFAPVRAVARVQVASPFARVFRRRMEMTERNAPVRRDVIKIPYN